MDVVDRGGSADIGETAHQRRVGRARRPRSPRIHGPVLANDGGDDRSPRDFVSAELACRPAAYHGRDAGHGERWESPQASKARGDDRQAGPDDRVSRRPARARPPGPRPTAANGLPAASDVAARTVASIQRPGPPRRPGRSPAPRPGCPAVARSRSRPCASRRCTVRTGRPSRHRGLLVRQALEVTQDDRRAEPLGQSAQLLVQLRHGISGTISPPARSFISAARLS